MEKRELGKSGLKVRPWMFGGNIFGWTVDEKTSFQILDAFMDSGFDFIDTADVYSAWIPGNRGGESETIIGKWFKARGNRSKVILATKVGMEMAPDKKGLSKKYILNAVEDSLKRLQTDYIDLYQSHKDDPDTPMEETLQAYDQLIKAGKVRVIGASNYNAKRLTEALQISERKKLPFYQSLQPLYNLYDRAEYEAELESVCREHHLGVIPYFSLASGFLTGKYRTPADLKKYARGGRVEKYMNDRGMRILRALDEVAENKKCTQSQVAIAWMLARPGITAPIASATNLDQVKSLAQAIDLKLDAASISLLNQASQP